ncbi:MAG: biotin transporter BioY [Methanomassiliicoccales archaeon]|nr:biotin transporter BioY [Methanomassiliicoccales archaeon]
MHIHDTVIRCRRLTSDPLYRWREEANVATKVGAALLFALLTALAAQMRFLLPFTPVPFTGQVLVVLLGAAVLGRYGALSQGMYLGLGAGLGWFSGMVGTAALSGMTGGYLMGFLVASFILGELVERKRGWSLPEIVSAMSLALLTIYALGAFQLAVVLGLGVEEALVLGVLPFLLVDGLKVAMASATASLFLRPRSI